MRPESARRAARILRGASIAAAGAWVAGACLAPGLVPPCLFDSILGVPCPGCGSTRAFAALVRGDLAAAWSLNAGFVAAVPVASLLWVRQRVSSSAFRSSDRAPAESPTSLLTRARLR